MKNASHAMVEHAITRQGILPQSRTLSPSQAYVLPPGQTQLWLASYEVLQSYQLLLCDLLSVAEQEKAQRFLQVTHQQHYRLAHGWLRFVLASYLPFDADQLVFHAQSLNKPQLLRSPSSMATLQFNLSHSADYVAIAVNAENAVGVDIECSRRARDFMRLAMRYFSQQEVEALRQQPTLAARKALFLSQWVCREAFLKALGVGLSELTAVKAVRLADQHGDCLQASALLTQQSYPLWLWQQPETFCLAVSCQQSLGELNVFTLRAK